MELDNEINIYYSQSMNNTKKNNEKNLLLSKEESSSTNFPQVKPTIKKLEFSTPRFHYKRIIDEKNSKSNLSNSERRLKKDLNELKNNKNVGKICKVIINDYKKIIDTQNFEMIIEFKNYFSTKFIFFSDYPFSPPSITFLSGNKFPNIFDTEGNILLETIKKQNWTPILWLSTLINSIELLLPKEGINYNKINSKEILIPKEKKYGKRKWDNFLKEEKSNSKSDISEINVLKKKLK